MADWRLQGQEKYLKGKTLKKKIYTKPSPDWDHEHCEFCWQKIAEEKANIKDSIHEAYCDESAGKWVCPVCFEDFKNSFNWELKHIKTNR
jgi:hypothetical protein